MNQINLVGTIGKDPEVREIGSDKKVCNFTLATNEYFKGEQTTTWHNCVAWNSLTDIVGKSKKGDKVAITGKIRYDTYEKDGVKQTATKIEVQHYEYISKYIPKESEDMPF